MKDVDWNKRQLGDKKEEIKHLKENKEVNEQEIKPLKASIEEKDSSKIKELNQKLNAMKLELEKETETKQRIEKLLMY